MAYIGNSPQFATQIPYRYTISATGTTVTGLDDTNKALTYTPGYVAVYVNGAKLIETLDYAATSGSSVVFVNAVQIGDVVEIIAYGTYSFLYGYRASATPPVSPNVGDLWYDLSTGILAIYINDGASSAWMQIAPTGILDPTLSQFLRNDTAQTLTTAQQTQVRSNIAAVPLDALAFNGMQINGSMEVSQENGTNLLTSIPNIYILDCWKSSSTGTMVVSAQQVADAPPGFPFSLKLSVTTAQTSLGTLDRTHIFSPIEGYRISRLQFGTASAQPFSIGFWSKIHRPGMYSGTVRNLAIDRSCPFTFTQNVADTWEYKTVTLPGDTTGTWITTNNVGMWVHFTVAAGTGIQNTAGGWSAGNFFGATGTTNGVAATSDTFQITGVAVLPGIQVPTATQSPFIMRPYDGEKLLCKRYYVYETYSNRWMWPIDLSSSYRRAWHFFNPEMRAVPVVAVTGISSGTPFGGGGPTATGISAISCELSGDLTGAGYCYITSLKADARM